MTRPARPDEKPEFGQVWQYADGGLLRMAIGLSSDGQHLVSVVLDAVPSHVDDTMFWRYSSRSGTMGEWLLHE